VDVAVVLLVVGLAGSHAVPKGWFKIKLATVWLFGNSFFVYILYFRGIGAFEPEFVVGQIPAWCLSTNYPNQSPAASRELAAGNQSQLRGIPAFPYSPPYSDRPIKSKEDGKRTQLVRFLIAELTIMRTGATGFIRDKVLNKLSESAITLVRGAYGVLL
jgi:hypothetical protein